MRRAVQSMFWTSQPSGVSKTLSRVYRPQRSNISQASASLVRVREMPALYHMVERRDDRTSVRSSWAWLLGSIEDTMVVGDGSGVGEVVRLDACCPAMVPMTSPSRREFDARRLAPWSPVQAASPTA